jgi:transcriptional regulator with XRE-family HTH domain
MAEAAGVSPRTVSDLERGMVAVPHRDTVLYALNFCHLMRASRRADT